MERISMAERILIVDDDVDTLRLVGLMLQRQGYEIISASNGSQGVEKALAEKPDLVLLDVMMPDMDGYEVTRRLRKNPATSAIPILMFTAKTQIDDKVAGFEVGADDYLTKPTHPTELQAHVRTLLSRKPAKKSDELIMSTTDPKDRGYVIGVISARGGLGVSTIAVNLAAALYAREKGDVLLAEFRPGHGTLSIDLGIANQTALTEMLQSTIAEVNKEKVQASITQHSSGIKLLLASENPRDVNLISQVRNFEIIFKHLTTLARFIVIDLGDGLPLYAQKILPVCNEQMLVLEGTASSIQYTKLLLEEITNLGISSEKISLILNNRHRTEGQLAASKVQEKLEQEIAFTLTPAPEVFSQATRLHSPVVISQPTNMTAQQFLKIADAVIKREKGK